ncbi:MAG: hypothetical protein WD772_01325 [Pseudohongiellaceae bacterium]
MEETRRQAYLLAMDMDCFMPLAQGQVQIRQAPAIAESPPSQPALPASPKPATKPGTKTTRQWATNNADEPKPVLPAAVVQSHSAGNETVIPELRFALQFFRFGESLAVINELPYLAGAETRKEELALLDRMLNALGKPPGRAVGAPELVFRWPINDGDLEATRQRVEARQLLRGMLHGRIAQGRFAYLLVMAGCSEELLLPAGHAAGDPPVLIEELGCKAVFTPSLGALVSDPALKRPVWQAIQPLVGILADLQ